jgi:hypothetical protein
VVLAFPIVILVGLAALVAFGINGSSSGVLYEGFYGIPDPNTIIGSPRSIRSDEFNVQTVYTVSQHQEGLPLINDSGLGGVNMSLNWEAPYKDWSLLFRPHQWGFLILPFANAFALKWWLPAAALLIACYLFAVTILPRRPLSSAMISVAFFLSPFIQWWYIPQTTLPLMWGFAAMAAIVWLSKLERRRWRWLVSLALAYLTTWGMLGFYAPFIIPIAVAVAGFILGWVFHAEGGIPLRLRLRALAFTLGAGGAGAAVIGVFIMTRLEWVQAMLNTVYPGDRKVPPGMGRGAYAYLPWVGPFQFEFGHSSGPFLLGNTSESSAFMLTGLFAAPILIWGAIRLWRKSRLVDTLTLGSLAASALILFYIYVPGWDPVAHLLFLDRSVPSRIVVGLGMLAVVILVLAISRVEEPDASSAPWLVGISASGCAWAVSLVAYLGLPRFGVVVPRFGVGVATAVIAGVALLLISRKRVLAATSTLAALGLLLGVWVNPFVRGVFDLRETRVGKAVLAQDSDNPGEWVALGPSVAQDVLIETGVGGANGMQGTPIKQAWEKFDPQGLFEEAWNRMGYVVWVQDPAAPKAWNPYPDVINVRFDACAPFIQDTFANVLSLGPAIEDECLTLESKLADGVSEFYLYSLSPPRESD